MKRRIHLITVAALLVFVWSACSSAADKIGFINVNEIIQTTNAGKKKVDDFKKYVEKKNEEIKSVEKELTKMKEELEKQSLIINESSRKEKEAAYQKKLRDYQLLANDIKEDIKRRDQDAIQKMVPGIMKIVRNVAEKENYTLVLDVSSMVIPYYAKENDFSKKVIEEYDKENK
ncbi:MAG: OmpH family outer membrane protein [Smithella sp.]